MKFLSELVQINEIKNELGETIFTTFAGWKRSVKQFYPDAWFDGDVDISNAMIGPKPYKRHETLSVGEWDGEQGVVFKGISLKKNMSEEQIFEDDELNVGDNVVVVGNVKFHGSDGYIVAFDSTKSFAVVKLYNTQGQHSFHVSDLEKMEEDDDDDEDEEDNDAEFYVTFHDENSGSSWIGMLEKEGGSKWREKTFKGESDYDWGGKSYMGYLSPHDVMSWIRRDYRRLEVDGPFYDANDAIDHLETNYGSIPESENSDSLIDELIEKSIQESKVVSRTGDFKMVASEEDFTVSKNGKKVFQINHDDWKDLSDAVKNRVSGTFGKFKLVQKGDSYIIIDERSDEAVYLSSTDMDKLISDSVEYLSSLKEDYDSEYDSGEYDQEGDMAKTQLAILISASEELMNMLQDDDNLPEWVQSKLTLAQDYVVTVRDYLKAKDADM